MPAKYTPLGAANDVMRCPHPRVLMEGPAGTGKTMALQVLSTIVCQTYPGARVLWARQTRKSMSESVLVTFENKVVGPGSYLVAGKASRQFRSSYDFDNGSQIVLSGLDNLEKTYSAEYDLVIIFEGIETRREDVEQLLRTLRNGKWLRGGNPFHQLIIDTNPGPSTHWLNVAGHEGWLHRLHSKHEDNPLLWNGTDWTDFGREYIKTLDGLSGARRERLRFGRWVSAEGLVYDAFDASVNVIDTMPAGWQSWRKKRSIDFGYSNPFVCQWWAFDGDGCAYLYRELYQTGKTVAQHAKDIIRLSEGETYEATVADHDAEDRATLHEAGVITTPAYKAISAGIQMVTDRMKKAGNGRPRLYILRDALVHRDSDIAAKRLPCCTLEEIDGYVWAKNTNGIKEDPVDRDNHGCDAMRYVIASEDKDSGFSFAVASPQATPADDDWRY